MNGKAAAALLTFQTRNKIVFVEKSSILWSSNVRDPIKNNTNMSYLTIPHTNLSLISVVCSKSNILCYRTYHMLTKKKF